MNKQKICLIDLETCPNVSYTWFGTHEIDVIEQVEEGYILSFAYKFLGDKNVKAYSLIDFKMDKRKLVQKLWEVFDESDIVVAHNGNQFDVKWANRAFVLYNLTPPSPYKTIDTLTVARNKFKFNSNRLNELGKYLRLGMKVETGGFGLWKLCMAGDKKAFKKMVKYNKNDIVLLEKVYLRLRPYMTNHPNINMEDKMVCPMCGGKDLIKRGFRFTTTMKNQRWVCKDCGRWSVGQGYRYLSKGNKLT